MKTPILTLGLAVWMITTSFGVSAGEGNYYAFWLTRNEKRNEYVDLVLSRKPLVNLVGVPVSVKTTVLDSDAVILTTYDKDSIWNIDRQPIKNLQQIDKLKSKELTIGDEVFIFSNANLKDVVKLLENPDGTIAIHRTHAPTEGQKVEIKELASRIRKQIKIQSQPKN